jgi:integrase
MNTALKLVQNQSIKPPYKTDYINRMAQDEPRTGVLFSNFITTTVTRKQNKMGNSYAKNYNTLINHLDGFSEEYDAEIFTNSINEYFLDDFIVYLESKDLKINYISTLVSLIKTMTKKAAMYSYAIDKTYDDVTVGNEIPFSVYLSEMEIARIYYFVGLTKKQERIRDLFVVGCFTGLRYSDYSTLTKENFSKDFIIKITKKTKTKVTIPLHEIVREVYDKYDGQVSPNLCIQHFNRYIKKICKKVGLNKEIRFDYTRGGRIINVSKPKWQLISSHTARRSAATNMYKTGRMSTYDIMALTGHKTEKSFFRYIKITQEAAVKRIAGDDFFRI